MNRRFLAVPLVTFSLLAFAATLKSQGPTTISSPEVPDSVTPGDDPSWLDRIDPPKPVYKPVKGTPWGTPCRICPLDLVQGRLNDCFLLSALGAISIASPGTIQKAIHDSTTQDSNGNEVYNVTMHNLATLQPINIAIGTEFPAMPTSHAAMYSAAYLSQPLFMFAQPPAGQSGMFSTFSTSGPIWPMIMEKAYAATLGGGYADDGITNGNKPYIPMQVVTGVPGGFYLMDAKAPSITSVFVQDTPAVPDVGGHSVIGGLLRGDLKAIQPNLQICISGSATARGTCTGVCRETHSCKATLPAGGAPMYAGQKVHVTVTDVSEPGVAHLMASFVEDNPASCTEKNPCTHKVEASQWADEGNVVISYESKRDTHDAEKQLAMKGILTSVDQVKQLLDPWVAANGTPLKPLAAGSLACQPTDPCARFFKPNGPLVPGHAYILMDYDRAGNSIGVKDPNLGGAKIDVPLTTFFITFTEIDYNDVARVGSSCGCN